MPSAESHGPVAALYAQLEADDDPGTWLVLADALIDAGDVRGELIQLHHAQASSDDPALQAQIDAFIRENAEALLGFVPPDGLSLEWRYGHVCEARLDKNLDVDRRAALLAVLFTHPGHRFLGHLFLDGPADERNEGTFQKLFEEMSQRNLVAPERLQSLQLGAGLSENSGYWVYRNYGLCMQDDLGGLWSRFPHLRTLRIDFGASELRLGEIVAPELRDFTWVSPSLPSGKLETLVKARWPKLERFILWTGIELVVNEENDLYEEVEEEDEDGWGNAMDVSNENLIDEDSFLGLADHLDTLPELKEMGIVNYCGRWAPLAEMLAQHDFWKRLVSINLSSGKVRDDGVDGLIRALSAAPRLEKLIVGNLDAPQEVVEKLRAGLPGVELVEETEDEAWGFYYIVTSE